MYEGSSSGEQNEAVSGIFTLSTIIGWRSRVLFSFVPEEGVLRFTDMRGRFSRIRKVNEADAYICEQLYEARTVADLLEQTRRKYPDLVEKRVYRLLNLLMEQALIEQKNIPPPSDTTEEELNRYDRQLRFFGLFAQNAQDRFRMQAGLTQATITILGLGGVGSWVARHLAAMGVGRVRLIDYDLVERSNLNRQVLYTPADIGKPKIEVAAKVLKTFNPRLEVQTIPLKIGSAEDIEQVLSDSAIVVLTADKPGGDIRRWTTVACARQHIPYIQGSLDTFFLQIGPLYHIPYTGCYVCGETSMQLAATQTSLAWIHAEIYRHSSRPRPPLLGPLCGFVGAAVALEIARYLSKYQPPITLGRYYVIDARTWTTHTELVTRHEQCPVCGLPQTTGAIEKKGGMP